MQYHRIEAMEIPDDVIDPTHQRRGYGIGKSNSDELIGRQSMVEQTQPARCSLPVNFHRIDQFSWPKACDYVYPTQQVYYVLLFYTPQIIGAELYIMYLNPTLL